MMKRLVLLVLLPMLAVPATAELISCRTAGENWTTPPATSIHAP